MNAVLKLPLTTICNSVGVILPKEAVAKLKLAEEDSVFAVETPSDYLLMSYVPAIEEQLTFGREFMTEYRETFRALAK